MLQLLLAEDLSHADRNVAPIHTSREAGLLVIATCTGLKAHLDLLLVQHLLLLGRWLKALRDGELSAIEDVC